MQRVFWAWRGEILQSTVAGFRGTHERGAQPPQHWERLLTRFGADLLEAYHAPPFLPFFSLACGVGFLAHPAESIDQSHRCTAHFGLGIGVVARPWTWLYPKFTAHRRDEICTTDETGVLWGASRKPLDLGCRR